MDSRGHRQHLRRRCPAFQPKPTAERQAAAKPGSTDGRYMRRNTLQRPAENPSQLQQRRVRAPDAGRRQLAQTTGSIISAEMQTGTRSRGSQTSTSMAKEGHGRGLHHRHGGRQQGVRRPGSARRARPGPRPWPERGLCPASPGLSSRACSARTPPVAASSSSRRAAGGGRRQQRPLPLSSLTRASAAQSASQKAAPPAPAERAASSQVVEVLAGSARLCSRGPRRTLY